MRNIRVKLKSARQSANSLFIQKKNFVFCELGGRRGFLVGDLDLLTKLLVQGRVTATVEETKKYSFMEQHIRMQTGRGFDRTHTELSTYQCKIIGQTESNQSYFVWEII